MTTSLVIGKFLPPHRGHLAMMDFALARSDKLYVIVCSTPDARPTGQDRTRWVQQIFPAAEVILTDDFCVWHEPSPCPESCTPKWASRTRELISEPIDEFIASEDYTEPFARAIGAKGICFDRARNSYPISGTAIRDDLQTHWPELHPIVRAGLCRKITVMGAESTGTTTLAGDLARALGCPLVPEIGRTVSWELMASAGSMDAVEWTQQDFWRILSNHSSAEESARHIAADADYLPCRGTFIADTDALATVAWWERYIDTDITHVQAFARHRLADAYIITSPKDVPFFQDGIRDGETVRHSMHKRFTSLANESGRPVLEVNGSRQQRIAQSIDFVAGLRGPID